MHLQEILISEGRAQPIISLTGIGDIRACVLTIVITSFDAAEFRAQCMASGAKAFLAKPLHSPTLLEVVAAATGRPSGKKATIKK